MWNIRSVSCQFIDGGMQRYFEKHEYNHDSKQSDPNADTDTHTDTHAATHDTSAFVPTDSMPGPARAFAENQPVTSIVNTIRDLPAQQEVGGLKSGYFGASTGAAAALVATGSLDAPALAQLVTAVRDLAVQVGAAPAPEAAST